MKKKIFLLMLLIIPAAGVQAQTATIQPIRLAVAGMTHGHFKPIKKS